MTLRLKDHPLLQCESTFSVQVWNNITSNKCTYYSISKGVGLVSGLGARWRQLSSSLIWSLEAGVFKSLDWLDSGSNISRSVWTLQYAKCAQWVQQSHRPTFASRAYLAPLSHYHTVTHSLGRCVRSFANYISSPYSVMRCLSYLELTGCSDGRAALSRLDPRLVFPGALRATAGAPQMTCLIHTQAHTHMHSCIFADTQTKCEHIVYTHTHKVYWGCYTQRYFCVFKCVSVHLPPRDKWLHQCVITMNKFFQLNPLCQSGATAFSMCIYCEHLKFISLNL